MERLKKGFPSGLDYTIVYNPTTFIQASVDAVITTLFEAVILVVIVVILFLQTGVPRSSRSSPSRSR